MQDSLEKSVKEEDRMETAFLAKQLEGNAKFTPLSSAKEPLEPYSKISHNSIPSKNYGLIPQKRLIILDIDTGAKLSDQREYFGKIFGVDLSETLSVATPSGGEHYYLFSPEEVPYKSGILPKGSIRGKILKTLEKEYGAAPGIDADLRSPQQLGYVVGPGSSSGGVNYKINQWKSIKTIPYDAYRKLVSISTQHYTHSVQEVKREDIDLSTIDSFPKWVLNGLEKVLEDREDQSYHAKRATVKSLLGCCYDDDSIAMACKTLGINRDTYANSFITDSQLIRDLENLDRGFNHGGFYCKRGRAHSKKNSKGYRAVLPYKNRGIRVSKREYRVLDLPKIFTAISYVVSPTSNAARDSFAVAEHFLNPLSNFGATKIVLAISKLREYFRMSQSRAIESLRVLRKAGVLNIYRKPSPGRATVYTVDDYWVDYTLTKILRKTWKSHVLTIDTSLHPSVEFDFRRRFFVDALTRQQLFYTSGGDDAFPSQLVPGKVGTVAMDYLVNEVDIRKISNGFSRSILWEPGLIILATIDDEFFERESLDEYVSRNIELEMVMDEDNDTSWMEQVKPLFELSSFT